MMAFALGPSIPEEKKQTKLTHEKITQKHSCPSVLNDEGCLDQDMIM